MQQPAGAEKREPGPDRLRGLVIVLMALDHARFFFHEDALRFSATDLTQTYPALFFTRFVTHFCAPTFALLAGLGAFLHYAKNRDQARTAKFLLTRGLWLVFLDVALISPIFSQEIGKFALGTLWAIGCGLVGLSALCFLGSRAVLAIGCLILASHDLFDSVHAASLGAFGPYWSLLHEPGPLPLGIAGRVAYPILPWIGVVALGYGLGPLFLEDGAKRARILTAAGLAAVFAFILLRGVNLYGDPKPWSVQPQTTMTALSFLNVSKYPPSLLYALVTLGPALILLPQMEKLGGAAGRILADFGRAPLFFYVTHLYLGVAAALIFAQLAKTPEAYRLGLPWVYVAWLALVAVLYPPCRWFANLKRRSSAWWLSYL
ncbi:DUF1624 domain-containing protein [Methylocystis bryophila]|uniref:Heparan-alpha-glucosaminide N-acetyltransferase catalytic domain-containing protein n=1 Tax=Methylocystis bryophila TaxID=655015 RepID=A0A1W6MRG7_9HYPH|nr:heparan-alpha-glucosaminide N-acetyltransferase domain-containing protein [Methylocystis bryophila]ARN80162.1 hypothetical protein B1812_02645 [Methylocystis bryophila]BDV40104.1 hypothetical protein DSM21852_33570 [Methylocystis bryophila]